MLKIGWMFYKIKLSSASLQEVEIESLGFC